MDELDCVVTTQYIIKANMLNMETKVSGLFHIFCESEEDANKFMTDLKVALEADGLNEIIESLYDKKPNLNLAKFLSSRDLLNVEIYDVLGIYEIVTWEKRI